MTRRGNSYPSTRGIPAAHRTFRGLMFSKTSGQLLREHTRNPRHLDLHLHTRAREMFMRQGCCARTPQAHLDLSPCAKRHVPAKRLLRSHAASTLGSLSVRKQEDMFMRQTAAFACHRHTWISLRAQRDMFQQNDCCVRTPPAHLDLSPCASKKTCSCDKLLRSHATGTVGSLSVRKETYSGEKTAAFSRRQHTWISLRAQARRHVHATNCCVRMPQAHLDLSPCASKKTCSCGKTAAFARHKHTWISFRAQRDMFRQSDCCVLTPRAHLDFFPCAKRHVPSKRLLRSRAAPQDR